MKYTQVYRVIRKLVDLLSDLNEKTPTFLVGFCGEVLVKSKLIENGFFSFQKAARPGLTSYCKPIERRLKLDLPY